MYVLRSHTSCLCWMGAQTQHVHDASPCRISDATTRAPGGGEGHQVPASCPVLFHFSPCCGWMGTCWIARHTCRGKGKGGRVHGVGRCQWLRHGDGSQSPGRVTSQTRRSRWIEMDGPLRYHHPPLTRTKTPPTTNTTPFTTQLTTPTPSQAPTSPKANVNWSRSRGQC
jgi:hypothetical protein